jgi:SAM-dependent methyltransferase
MSGPYWGVFEELLRDSSVHVEEVSPFHGVAAELYDQLNPPRWDDSEYVGLAAACAGPILDLGCGTGRMSLKLAAAGHHVVGLDVSDEMLNVFRSKLQSMPSEVRDCVNVVCANAGTFRLESRFDLVLLLNFTLGIVPAVERWLTWCATPRVISPTKGSRVQLHDCARPGASSLAGDPMDREFSLGGRPLAARRRRTADSRALVANVC